MHHSAAVVGRLVLAALVACASHVAAGTLPAWKQRLQPEADAWKRAEQHFLFNNGTEPEGLDPARKIGRASCRERVCHRV